ncbi:MAG: Coenzyme F420 hydrogenase/dehydrogenase, beta subunit C-terminal domain [Butyrivibrio sp.]|uniref:Coenzyme F420 hydrogenase/dehydrogenase, beta subunit C-terminal domain n=1 Tax=Butyrivibrio sp. TaxID=28121 RepID=UPI0025E24F22|nr:Coenzyme F420 hydrogenase/dehydrogenase, beta subunit C-terminal domain [Butyrivibrio sp.]MCR5770843.1 Coenzyme F420 hydrogenase/dehydrogenase, beta subunit C-terminal domain [Butyrivibrio sp.]
MQSTVCELNKCTGCAACLEVCSKNAITIKDSLKAYNAVIDNEKCVSCNACHKICQNNSPIISKKPESWYQGWTKDKEQRLKSSSGGVATALAKYFVANGGIVCSCIFRNGKFIYDFAESLEDVEHFSGSKYVKSNPTGIYKKIKGYLLNNKKVLFIGLPCHAAALKKFVGEKNAEENLYLVDLICHGSPSPRNITMFLENKDRNIIDVKHLAFRDNNNYRIMLNGQGLDTPGVYDSFLLAFLNGINFTENCYSCNYAKIERVTDITIGDSWGSRLSAEEIKAGISLMLCQTEKGLNLLEDSGIELIDVNLDNAVAHNHQLEHPYIKPTKYDKFFNVLLKTSNYDNAVKASLTRTYINQQIKRILVKLKIVSKN